MEENNIDLIETKEINNEETLRKAQEKKKSTFRLFWLFVVIDLILLAWIIYLIISIFIDAFQGV